MAIDPETHVNASVILEKEVYQRLKAVAKRNKRSVSSQIAFWVEEKLDEECRRKQK